MTTKYWCCGPTSSLTDRLSTRVLVSFVVLLSVTLASLALAPTLAARSYSFEHLRIDAWVREDGRLDVEEHRTTRFSGQFSGMFQWIDTSAGLTVGNIQVSEGEMVYEQNEQPQEGPPGTFFVRQDAQSTYVDWSFSARDELRTFTLRYTLDKAVRLHNDVGELYIQFVGDQWDVRTDSVDVRLYLPPGAERTDLRAWGHGPLHGQVDIIDGQQVQWQVAPLPANTMLEGRVTFPTRLLQDQPPYAVISGRLALDEILQEEQQWAREANLERWGQRLNWALGAIVLMGALVLAIHSFIRWGLEFRPQFDGDYFRELPKPYSPAEMSVLYTKGTVATRDLTATVLDLARRKWIKIEEASVTKGRLRKTTHSEYTMSRLHDEQARSQEETLAPHEQTLLQFLFETVDEDATGSVSFSDLETFAKKRKSAFAQFWERWKGDVKDQTEQYGFFDTTNSAPKKKMVLVGLGLLVLGVPLFFVRWYVTVAGLVIGGALLLVLGAAMNRRSREGVEDFAKWKAFRRFLLHFSEMHRHDIPSLVLWEHFLVFAVSLGVAKQVIKQLQVVFPGLEENGYRFGHGWYYLGASGMGNVDNSLNRMTTAMQNSFQQSISTATSQSSSGSGSGGGFSGGGGGGVGGGGGGAR